MECIYAALLLHKAGKPVDAKNLKKVLEAAGVSVDETRVKALVASLSGVNLEEVIKTASAAPVASTASEAAPAAQASKEGKKEAKEKKEEEKKEEEKKALAGLSSLFG